MHHLQRILKLYCLATISASLLRLPLANCLAIRFQVQDRVDDLLVRYLRHLLSQGKYNLIPFYTCRLSAGARRQMCCDMLSQLSKEGDSEAKQAAYESLDHCFTVWRDQELGDVETNELDIVLELVSFWSGTGCFSAVPNYWMRSKSDL